jgi:hypothetical protein
MSIVAKVRLAARGLLRFFRSRDCQASMVSQQFMREGLTILAVDDDLDTRVEGFIRKQVLGAAISADLHACCQAELHRCSAAAGVQDIQLASSQTQHIRSITVELLERQTRRRT